MNGKLILKWTDTKTVHFLYDNHRKVNRKDVIACVSQRIISGVTIFRHRKNLKRNARNMTDIGFRVVTFLDGDSNTNIHDGIKALVKNHWDNV